MALGLTQPLNRNEYQEYFLGGKRGRCVGLTTLPPSCADCLEILEPQPPGTLRACPGIALSFYLCYCKKCRQYAACSTRPICFCYNARTWPTVQWMHIEWCWILQTFGNKLTRTRHSSLVLMIWNLSVERLLKWLICEQWNCKVISIHIPCIFYCFHCNQPMQNYMSTRQTNTLTTTWNCICSHK